MHLFQSLALHILIEKLFSFLRVHKIMEHFIINGILHSIIYSDSDVNVTRSRKLDNTSYIIIDKHKLAVSPIAWSVKLKKFVTNMSFKMQCIANHISFCKIQLWLQIFRLYL